MYENTHIKPIKFNLAQCLIAIMVSFGAILATTHGAFLDDYHDTSANLNEKITKDLHIHNDAGPQYDGVLVDPKSLRGLMRNRTS